jgi:hypothetical protein
LIDWLYNLMIVLIAAIWIAQLRGKPLLRRRPISPRAKVLVGVALWLMFILSATLFVANYAYLERSHDVDDAVQAAVDGFLDGTNPYESPIVPRFAEMGHFAIIGGTGDGTIEWAYGPYNYLPVDLLVYSAAFLLLGGLGSPGWFVAANVIFTVASFYILNRMLRLKWTTLAPLAGCAAVLLAFDNSSLTLMLMVSAMYLWKTSEFAPRQLSIIMLGLATLTKVFAVIPLAVLVLYDLQEGIGKRDRRLLLQSAAAVAACAVIAIVMIVPFGLSNVLDSTVFIYSSGEVREDRPMGGTILSELIPDSPYYSLITLVTIAGTLLAGLKFKSKHDRVILVALAFLLVSVKSTLAPFTVPLLYLVLRADEAHRAEPDEDVKKR